MSYSQCTSIILTSSHFRYLASFRNQSSLNDIEVENYFSTPVKLGEGCIKRVSKFYEFGGFGIYDLVFWYFDGVSVGRLGDPLYIPCSVNKERKNTSKT